MKTFIVAIASALVASGAVTLVKAAAAAPVSQIVDSGGRFRVVNGTPEMTRNIMLLDTQTGKTWIICGPADGASGWCPMPISNQ